MSSALADRERLEPGAESSSTLARLLAIGSVVSAWVCAGGFAVVAAPVLVAWLGSGAQEPLPDVLSVAGAGWLLGLGATVSAGEATWALTPLGLTLLSLVLAYRGGLWAAESVGPSTGPRIAAFLGSAAAGSAVIGGVTASLMGLDGLSVDPGEAAAQAGLVTVTGAAAGVLTVDPTWRERLGEHLPGWLAAAARPALAALAVLAAGAAAVTTVALVGSFGTVTSLLEQLDPGGAGLLALAVACLAYLPTLLVWTLSVLLGPGVSLGSQVTVTSWTVDVGPLPGFPLLGVVPETIPGWLPLVGALTVAGAGIAAGLLVRRTAGAPVHRWEPAATGGAAGLAVGTAVAVTAWAASGPMGPGDLSWWGVHAAAAGGLSGLAVAVGAALTATAHAWRRGDYRPSLDDSDSLSAS